MYWSRPKIAPAGNNVTDYMKYGFPILFHSFCVFFVTITRRSDGTYRPNFKPVNIEPGFNAKAYALCVFLELNKALKGLVENS